MEAGGYELRESTRAKRVTVTIHPNGKVTVTKPKRATMRQVEAFVQLRRTWIEQTVESFRKRSAREAQNPKLLLPQLRRGTRAYEETRENTRALVFERLPHLNQIYGFSYETISIRNQKTRWGSCSRKGNLSFNYRIKFLPPELCDYILVHELCHIKEHNHSSRFWAQVARTFPGHRALRKQLHQYQ